MKTTEKRIHKFIQLLADQLHKQFSLSDEENVLLSSSPAVKNSLVSSIQGLPESSLKNILLQNEDHLLELLCHALQERKAPKKFILRSRKERINAIRNEVDAFLRNFGDGTLDASKNYRQSFSQMLLEEAEDPPLELLWCLSAVKFMQENCQTKDDDAHSGFLASDNANSRALVADRANSRVSVAKALFQCLAACTVGHQYSASISIAALAPTIVVLVDAVTKLAINPTSKTLSKAYLKSLKNFVGQIAGHIAVCGNKGKKSSVELSLARALPCCGALFNCIDFWDRDKGLKCSIEKDLGEFFPFSSACVHAALLEKNCSVDYLATVVILEVSLLQLVLEVFDRRRMMNEGSRCTGRDVELRQNLRILAVNSIGTANNIRFFDILLELLLESKLPVVSLLTQEEEVLLRGVLYEATTLVDYAFLKQNREPISNEAKSVVDENNRMLLNRLVLAQKTVQFFRSLGEHSRAVLFSKTFSNVPITPDLMKWMGQRSNLKYHEALTQNPQDLVGYLVNLEDQQGLKQIVNKHPAFYTNTLPAENIDTNLGSNATTTDLPSNLKNSEVEDDLFFVDTKGDTGGGKRENEFESVGKSFVLAAHGMESIENDGKKKKKRQRKGKRKQKINFQRHVQHDVSTKENWPQELGSDLSMSEDSDLESSGLISQKKSRIKTQALDEE
ncbi:hypothetical protein SUGI_0246590 [Cryptomeria japonica]|uniref:uncharacterized protein LOC131035943 n=1 Tax=Cryptomeria japonica TaxID=3369 RepID=UPI002408B953|nr:uncharacterized protein LOC131035943 [Cryptomeria japonica]GLJ15086.1 hypothetical protein SUGI_0246590 [Cryptomeria japonica]